MSILTTYLTELYPNLNPTLTQPYTDLVEFAGLSKLAALIASFVLSAIVHEYLICIGMVYP